MGPTAIVLETTTIPISESVPCQAVEARTPDKRPGTSMSGLGARRMTIARDEPLRV
jgi:hypothetical protein